MGTTWTVHLANPQFVPLEPIRAAIETALGLVVRQMSNWQDDSNISCFNQAPAGTWLTFPPESFTVLSCALQWAKTSDGAWDPTIGPLVNIWGFGPCVSAVATRTLQTLPDAAAIAQARHRIGYQRIMLHPAQRRVLQPGNMHLDLCGIAKGYSVDLISQTLLTLGMKHFLVEVGGELRACGQRPDGLPWRVAIANAGTLPLHNLSIATSGDQWHVFEINGRRYSHTLDPRTGQPVTHNLASVTVLHAECMHADALATILTVLGPEEGLAFAKTRGIAALLCQRTTLGMEITTTPAWETLTTP